MVRDGRVAALWGGGAGWPGFTNLMKDGNARFIAPSAEEVARIVAKHSFLKPLTLPAGTYPNQNEPMQSVGSWSYVVARTSLPDEIAYKLIRAVHKGEGALAKRLARQDMLHPGVLRYLREIGLAR